jgi:methionyl-tRNA synthetase
VGKDILRHHAVYWPAFLLSAGLPLPTTIWAHGWWLRDKKKVSKSSGNIVRPDELLETFGPDVLRFFLLREMVFGQDAGFSDEAFVDRYNTDLANDLGNTVSRVVTLSRKHFGNAAPPVAGEQLREAAETAVREYHQAMGELAFHRALEALWRLLAQTNQYLVAEEPWKRVKSEGASDHVASVLWNGIEAVRVVATALLPIVPHLAAKVLRALGSEAEPKSLQALAWGGTPTGAPLPKLAPLFPRVDKNEFLESQSAKGESVEEKEAESAAAPEAQEAAPQEPQIDIEQFMATQLRVATIKAAEPVPKSNKLLKLQVDLGEETRQLVAGIAKAYAPEDLVGKQVVVVANLKPAKLMGVESQGMVLAASVEGRPVLLHPEEVVPEGTRVR